MPFTARISMIENHEVPPPVISGIDLTVLSYIQFVIYFIICWRLIQRTNKAASPENQENLRSIKKLLLIYLVTYLCLVINYSRQILLNGLFTQKDFSHTSLIWDFPIFIICVYNYYLLLKKPFGIKKNAVKGKYQKSGLSDDDSGRIFNRLNQILQKEKIWFDPDINLSSLAEKMGCSYNHLSQAINRSTGLNYHAFMNHYRINEACRLLETTDLTIIEIAYNAGFNSKATFNAVFKKEKNSTPSQFRKEYKKKSPILSGETV